MSDEDGRCPEWPAPRDPAILAGRMVGAARNLGKYRDPALKRRQYERTRDNCD
ncbi:MAG: hypothetical protein RXQ62_05310 [Nitrososphaeria archaeon]